jgi:ABC-type transporter Mla subunit MlaD
MPAPNPDLERRVDRNANDIEAIYDILTDHGGQLTDLQDKAAAIQVKLGEHDAQLSEILRRLNVTDDSLAKILRRLDVTDDRLAEILRRLPEAS